MPFYVGVNSNDNQSTVKVVFAPAILFLTFNITLSSLSPTKSCVNVSFSSSLIKNFCSVVVASILNVKNVLFGIAMSVPVVVLTVGVNRLKTRYGSRKNRGMRPEVFRKSSGKIIRTILQQAEKAELLEKTNELGRRSGRKLTEKGKEFMEAIK